ncbi:hypothetical protein [Microbacterium sp. zg.Y909]|uniref:hypothetical protein n=1 Tax=Microbacterium sp. zg.Y909 TaxID=2969413 RepID=UPI00214BD7B1|nr:hypothetical protein [Microbacterium sp. zg.Y909]MCR2824857.1 hypothetical protein [Microbacterium sp. zg.Y909]
MPHPGPLPLSLEPWFSTTHALTLGATPGRLRASDLEAPFHGARVILARAHPEPDAAGATAPHDTVHRDRQRRDRLLVQARAFATVMPDHAFFTAMTAAVLWGLPLPPRPPGQPDPEPLHVAVFAPRRLLRAAGVRGHETTPMLTSIQQHRGIPVAIPASTWASLGRFLSVARLVAVGDAIVHQPRQRGGDGGGPATALATLDDLASAVAAGRRVGVGRLREALPRIRVGSMSPGETDLREALIQAGLPEPELDVDLVDATGRRFGWTEIAYPRWRVLVEYEGDHHRTDRVQWHRDVQKHARCRDLGWDVVRVTAGDVYPRPRRAVERVRHALMRAGWRP